MKTKSVVEDGTVNKERILASVRDALSGGVNLHADISLQDDDWLPFEDGDEFTFIENFKKTGGIFMYFESVGNFVEALRQFVEENKWSILTSSPKIQTLLQENDFAFSDDLSVASPQNVVLLDCECLVAQTGSIVFTTAQTGSPAAVGNADTLLVMATPRQFVSRIKDALETLRLRYPALPPQSVFVTGQSSSSDIDNTLVKGALGIRKIALFLVEED